MATSASQQTRSGIPIFVGTRAAFPGITWRVLIREDDTRCMIQHCIDSGSLQFGVCTSTAILMGEPFSDFGTLVTIKNQIARENGTVDIDAVGSIRFVVTGRRKRDCYYTASVKFIGDVKVTRQQSIEKIKFLCKEVYEDISNWYTSLDAVEQGKIRFRAGDMPSYNLDSDPLTFPEGPTWIWWAFATREWSDVEPSVVVGCPYLEERLLMLRQDSDSSSEPDYSFQTYRESPLMNI